MKKSTIDLILSILLFTSFFFTGFYALAFVAGLLFGDYLVAKFNIRGDEKEVQEATQSWASQFELKQNDNWKEEEGEEQ